MYVPLLVTLMPIPLVGGPMVIPTQKVLHFDNLLTTLNLSQLIREPTNLEDNKSLSCIDLTICDQPNFVRPSPDNFCKQQMTCCNLNLHIPPPPVYSRKLWHYNRANSDAMTRAVTDFPWINHLRNLDPSQQVEFFNNKILNIASNFMPDV